MYRTFLNFGEFSGQGFHMKEEADINKDLNMLEFNNVDNQEGKC